MEKAASRVLGASGFRALVVLFTVSGAAGLVDQVCFSKYLSYVVGATAYAVSAVLAAFMTGLAVGATIGGRTSSRVERPLAAYGVAEILVGLSVAASPLAFAALTPTYVALARHSGGSLAFLSVVRWIIAFLFVAIPTAAMGATLPLVAAALSSGHDYQSHRIRERRLGTLYAANTLGGAAGALIGAYAVLPALGLSKSLYAAAATSALVGALSLLLSRSPKAIPSGAVPPPAAAASPPPTSPSPASPLPSPASLSPSPSLPPVSAPPLSAPAAASLWLTVLAFLSGFLVFCMEVISTHLLVVIVGSSAYAFGLILAAFLLSLFAGAALAAPLSRRARDAALGYSLAFSALAVAATLPLWDDLPFAFGGLGEYVKTFAGREAMRALVAFGILAVPATCMGLTFPLVLRWAAAHHEVGRFVGRLTAVNTAGAVFGALGTGYVLLPAFGSERSLLFVSLAFAGAAALTSMRKMLGYHKGPALLSAMSVTVAFLAPRWDLLRLTAGTNVYFDTQKTPDKLLRVREDVHGGITTVTLRDNVRTLYTNGKFQGNDGWELNAQRYFAHYPCLFVKNFDGALVIGLGTGTTLGTLSVYPWKRIDVLEISPAIVEAARNEFPHTNRRALEDPRVHVTIDDARNHLLVTEGRYSLIAMELSSVWFAGASSLYSEEYYRLIRDHLTEDGVYQQWVQMHHIYRPVFAALVNTLRREFEHVALFYGGGQGILVSSKRPLQWSLARAERLSSDPTFQEVLPNARTLDVLTGDILAMDDGLDRFLADSAAEVGVDLAHFVSNDDNLFLEYQTPRGNVLPWDAREALVTLIRGYRDPGAVAAMETDHTRTGAN